MGTIHPAWACGYARQQKECYRLANLPSGYHTRIVVGGSADIALPDNPNLSIHVMAGGRISNETVGGVKRDNFATLVYGSGAARLDLTVGGSVRVLSVPKE